MTWSCYGKWRVRPARMKEMFDCEGCRSEFEKLSEQQTPGVFTFSCGMCGASTEVKLQPPIEIVDQNQYHMLLTAAGKAGTCPTGGFPEFCKWLKDSGIRFRLKAIVSVAYHGHPRTRLRE